MTLSMDADKANEPLPISPGKMSHGSAGDSRSGQRRTADPPMEMHGKKRTKASRACDQCRRKKIKCDYNDMRNICTNCQRIGERCSFERVPLKRGPTKGYSRQHRNSGSTAAATPTAGSTPPEMDRQKRHYSVGSAGEQNRYVASTPTPGQVPNAVLLPPLANYGYSPQLGPERIQDAKVPKRMSLPDDGALAHKNSNLDTAGIQVNAARPSSSGGVGTGAGKYPGSVGALHPGIIPGAGVVTGTVTPNNVNVAQQQFWKVPYHDYPHQRRGSIDSLLSDISVRNLNSSDQLFYGAPAQPPRQQSQSPAQQQPQIQMHQSSLGSPISGNIGAATVTNSVSGPANGPYWSYFKNFNPITNPEDQDMQFRRSSSIPSLLRQNSNPVIAGQQQLPHPSGSQRQPSYPYSQFHNHQQQQQQHQTPQIQGNVPTGVNTTTLSSFGQYATNGGFHSRNSSTMSEAMSPSASTVFPNSTALLPENGQQRPPQAGSAPNQRTPTTAGSAEKTTYAKTNCQIKNFSLLCSHERHHANSGADAIVRPTSVPVVRKFNPEDPLCPTDTPSANKNVLGNSKKGSPAPHSTNVFKRSDSATSSQIRRGNSITSISSLMDPVAHPTAETHRVSSTGNVNSITNPKLTRTPMTANVESALSGSGTRSNMNQISCSTTPVTKDLGPEREMKYGRISDMELIDIYYEFIHTGFPIIPLNKKTLTGDILLINTQPVSSIHELNNYVILWFRNSLELLVRLAMKRGKGSFLSEEFNNPFDAESRGSNKENARENPLSNNGQGSPDGWDINKNPHKKKNSPSEGDDLSVNDYFEIQTIFISALNECFQKIVDIHPKLRENKDMISPKIKIIYLSTFIILNYILSYVGYDNSFVLGMSVTIFNEFKLYKILFVDTKLEKEETPNETALDCSIVFKRLYVLLIIFDSLQSCTFGGPKLLNIPITGTIDSFFDNSNLEKNNVNSTESYVEKWCIEEDPVKLHYMLQDLKLGEFITELSIHRKSVNYFSLKSTSLDNLAWIPDPPRDETHPASDAHEFITISRLFHDLLITKQKFINTLISLSLVNNSEFKLTLELSATIAGAVSKLITQTLQILTLAMRLNPTNSIDPVYRPLEKPQPSPASSRSANSLSIPTDAANDFYQKLLGLNKDKNKDNAETLRRGVIAPYAVPIFYELHNVINIIKKLPTQLIGTVMQVAYVDNSKAQSIVVKLSNSMNELVQIMSLLNMIRPFKIFDTDLNERSIVDESSVGELKMKWKFVKPDEKPGEKNEIVERFINIGWKLFDDAELGWL
ncbi:Rgt1p KNAG_0A07100 [Huiozyma naganishii CBS 8797]|uniref:Zn(2)-C6 fungal-type domain-containing protein n=1 Tax=Huiozyma naganishii (strain ATCC MYA-139 / BCRC 22969 / CBS 8797 / KCTC 17520 / NBRC 10181 / NCYC 3082 / Yp74L-3) TaxID=1071383 RepID=J7S2V1_HUIN7|nr:hypothetical protein KNAG_0A07100 [Kazachstania naganishii CBS 8797]CCK68364.1 hypothetical protein KNAG_0A07100 [Kazachstania naganishii CBS 8797]